MNTNPVEIIKEDHRTVEGLFADYTNLAEDAYADKRAIADQIIDALTVHTDMEETLAYPRFKELFDDEEDKKVEEAYAEHEVAKHLMAELKSLSPEDEQFDAKMTVLEESIAHHVKEEENTLLPLAEKEIPAEEMDEIGQDMLEFKAEHAAELEE
jgi:hemerythrin-like domain-containing protein